MLLIGQAPGPRTDPDLPLYPLPATATGGRLIRLMGVGLREYLRGTERVNLLQQFPGKHRRDDRFPMRPARAAAQELLPRMAGRVVVLVGRNVANAFSLPIEFLVWWPALLGAERLACIPHPSGRNRWYNDPARREQVASFMSEVRELL